MGILKVLRLCFNFIMFREFLSIRVLIWCDISVIQQRKSIFYWFWMELFANKDGQLVRMLSLAWLNDWRSVSENGLN